ncbi:hypothetical protein Ddye_026594 [Dipteronia dyeriana]|uniref:Uncharacterized protein n=1 Tax=Dipteronia dyeriana TaxID=168575 RepID=A0AAD9TMG3_9ROSI|nr:hypothetical protein Ddye_026594 [Dipteronia dyeriana]
MNLLILTPFIIEQLPHTKLYCSELPPNTSALVDPLFYGYHPHSPHLFSRLPPPLSSTSPPQPQRKATATTTTTKAFGSDKLGDFRARDPFPAEVESGSGEKVLGIVDTEHKILIPNLSTLCCLLFRLLCLWRMHTSCSGRLLAGGFWMKKVD